MDIWRVCIYVPGANSIEFVSEEVRFHLNPTADDGWWFREINFPKREVRYRFMIDGVGHLPDPFNSGFSCSDFGYFSLYTPGEQEDVFSERPKYLSFVDRIPAPDTPVHSIRKYGPANENLVAVLCVEGLHRTHNHVLWDWELPERHYFLDNIIRDSDSFAYCAIPYKLVDSFGTWRVSAFLNGRFSGTIAAEVSPLTYSYLAPPASTR